jgi:cyclophilin family peptidyl-prolyl cis-trans isomerase
VIKDFMIQCGGFDVDHAEKQGKKAPIVNEATNGLKNKRGTLAYARTNDPNSATSQFFINLVNNDFLDHRSTNPSEFGYAVFGKVTDGMKVVDAIAKVKVQNKDLIYKRQGQNINQPSQNVPAKVVSIESIEIVE